MQRRLDGTGVWSGALRHGDPAQISEAAAELEELGYDALWVPDVGGDVFGAVEHVLRATRSTIVATGILNVWMHTAAETAEHHAALQAGYDARFLLGLGISHRPLIDRFKEPGTYQRPLATMQAFLDQLDAAPTPVARDDRLLAALGPRMLELARDRTAGSHPYLVTPELTAAAREGVGPDGLLAVEQGVVLDTDPVNARAVARTNLATYFGLPNYTNNWKRQGFTDEDLADGGSERLVDALVAWGDEEAIARRVQEQRDAGADHVCIQVLTAEPSSMPLDGWRRLAPVLVT
jgi:probable F420-dependent oxidoreductase